MNMRRTLRALPIVLSLGFVVSASHESVAKAKSRSASVHRSH